MLYMFFLISINTLCPVTSTPPIFTEYLEGIGYIHIYIHMCMYDICTCTRSLHMFTLLFCENFVMLGNRNIDIVCQNRILSDLISMNKLYNNLL